MAEEDPQDLWEDNEAAKKVNGIYANRIYVQPIGDGMVRINFGEIIDHEPTYHSAIVVTAPQAKQFAQLIFNVGTAVVNAEYHTPEKAAPPPTVSIAPPPSVTDIIAQALAENENDSGRG